MNGLRRYRSCLLSSDVLHSVVTTLDPVAFVKLENHSGFASVYRAVYISVDSASYRAHSYHRAYKHSGLEVLLRDALPGTFNTMHRFW